MEFENEIRASGLNPPSPIPAGQWIRFPGYGKSNGNTSGFAYLYPDGEGGIYGDWANDIKNYWRHSVVDTFTPEQLIDYNAIVKAAQKEAERKQEESWAEAAKRAGEKWDAAGEPKTDHPYLKAKQVKVYGIRQSGDKLIIPLHDLDGNITTLQEISPDGSKKLMYGGKKKGSVYPIPGNDDVTFVCEGYATGASIREVTGRKVVVAIDAGNLEPVVESLLQKGCRKIVIAADNDNKGEKNTGIDTAKKICGKHPSVTYVAPPTGDWNDHVILHGAEDAKARLLDEPRAITLHEATEEIGKRGLSLDPALWESCGLLALGMAGSSDLSGVHISQFNYPTTVAHIATAISDKIFYKGVYPSFFFVRIGGTSTGKSTTDQAIKNVVQGHFTEHTPKGVENTFYGPTDFSSGPGLLRDVARQPRCMIIMDEITTLFTRKKSPDALEMGKTATILELSTASERTVRKVYSDAGNNIVIEGAVINLTGNATSGIFSSFTLDDLNSGLVQRFDFFSYDGKIPYRTEKMDESPAAIEFALALRRLRDIPKPKGRYDLTKTHSPVNIGATKEAKDRLWKLSCDLVDMENAEPDEGVKGLMSRSYDSSIKFALIHHASISCGSDLFDPLTLDDVEYGIKVASLLLDWKIKIFVPSVAAGDFDVQVKMFLDGIKSVMSMPKAPTQTLICARRPKLKNLTQRQWKDIVDSCVAHGLIRVREDGKITVYEILKKKEGK